MEQTKNAIDDNDGSDDEFFDACEDVRERKFSLLAAVAGCPPWLPVASSQFSFLYLSNENLALQKYDRDRAFLILPS